MKKNRIIGLMIIFYTFIFVSNSIKGQSISYKKIIDNKIQYCFDSTQWKELKESKFHLCFFNKQYKLNEVRKIKQIVKVLNKLYKDPSHSISRTPKWFRKYIGKPIQDGENRFIYTIQNKTVRLYIISTKPNEATFLDFYVNLLDVFTCGKPNTYAYHHEYKDYKFLKQLNISLPILHWECPVEIPKFGWQ